MKSGFDVPVSFHSILNELGFLRVIRDGVERW